MILRRVISHVRKQEWAAIAIDFLIVVIGVFMGLQVSNWNEARANDNLAVSYIKRLQTDIELEIVLWQKSTDYFRATLEKLRAELGVEPI